jgi:hypothetical protein
LQKFGLPEVPEARISRQSWASRKSRSPDLALLDVRKAEARLQQYYLVKLLNFKKYKNLKIIGLCSENIKNFQKVVYERYITLLAFSGLPQSPGARPHGKLGSQTLRK